MKAMLNKTHIEGLLYDTKKLELKTSGAQSKNPGTQFISGEILIATDDACLNIIPVHYTYVTATTNKGKPNSTFPFLKNIIDGTFGTVMRDGKEKAVKVKVDSAIGLNDFYIEENGEDKLVSSKRNEGGFISRVDVIAADEKTRDTFDADMIITKVTHVDADESRKLPEKVVVKGAIFDFRKALLPVEFSAVNPLAIQYFESLDASSKNPVFTKIWGRQVNETSSRQIEEESAWGEVVIKEIPSSHKDWIITGASKAPYEWDSEETITARELTDAMANRETYLAEVKQRWKEWKNSQGATAPASAQRFDF